MDIFGILSNKKTGMLILKLEDKFVKTFKFGWKITNEIVFKDISVSRCHGLFYIAKKRLFIIDNYSKFGSLIKIPN